MNHEEYRNTHGGGTGREPVCGLPWRAYLKDLARSILLCLAVMAVSAAVVGIMTSA